MDFSWVRQLAEESNQHQQEKNEAARRKREEERMVAIATVPFVEKLFKLIQVCCEEYNKYCVYPDLRVIVCRSITRKAMGVSDLEDSAFFSFARRSAMYGIRGASGVIEFVDDVQVSDVNNALNLRLDEMTVAVVYKLVAKVDVDLLDTSKKSVIWTLNDEVMDGPKLITLCQHYFTRCIKRTDD